MGMYELDRSGETDRIRIRGSGSVAASSVFVGVGGWISRLMSGSNMRWTPNDQNHGLQHSDRVRAPTSAQGSEGHRINDETIKRRYSTPSTSGWPSASTSVRMDVTTVLSIVLNGLYVFESATNSADSWSWSEE